MSDQFPPKDPASILRYGVDWSAWLAEGEAIIGTPAIEADGLDLNPGGKATQVTDGKVTFWLGGGTAGTFYTVACTITTSLGQTERRCFPLRMR